MQKVKVGKLSRSLGIALTAKAGKYLERRPYPPGQHGKNKRRTQSDYGKQLLEKQRLRAQYNIREKQLRNYFDEAYNAKGSTGINLLQLLESRLDVMVLRAGFAPTIYSARQMINHRHIIVDGKFETKPGFRVPVGSTINPSPKALKHPLIASTFASAVRPEFVAANLETLSVSRQRLPERLEIPVICNEQMVVEFYSR